MRRETQDQISRWGRKLTGASIPVGVTALVADGQPWRGEVALAAVAGFLLGVVMWGVPPAARWLSLQYGRWRPRFSLEEADAFQHASGEYTLHLAVTTKERGEQRYRARVMATPNAVHAPTAPWFIAWRSDSQEIDKPIAKDDRELLRVAHVDPHQKRVWFLTPTQDTPKDDYEATLRADSDELLLNIKVWNKVTEAMIEEDVVLGFCEASETPVMEDAAIVRFQPYLRRLSDSDESSGPS